jgi:hypothetical protein
LTVFDDLRYRASIAPITTASPQQSRIVRNCKAETAAFGYPRERLLFEQRAIGAFGYPRHAPSVTAGDGLTHSTCREEDRSNGVHTRAILWRHGLG